MSDDRSAPALNAPIRARRRTQMFLTLGLLLLSMGGIAVLQFRSEHAMTYWLIMVPIFAVVNAVGAWPHAHDDTARRGELVRRLVLHWMSLVLAIALIFLVMDGTSIGGEESGMIAALLLALTCFLAGVHFDWHFLVLGTVLGLTVAGGAVAEQYFWFAMIVVVIAAIVVTVVRRKAPSRE